MAASASKPRKKQAVVPTATASPAAELPPAERGLVCRHCGCTHFHVIYTRQRDKRILRRRECRHCGTRISTWERVIGESSGG